MPMCTIRRAGAPMSGCAGSDATPPVISRNDVAAKLMSLLPQLRSASCSGRFRESLPLATESLDSREKRSIGPAVVPATISKDMRPNCHCSRVRRSTASRPLCVATVSTTGRCLVNRNQPPATVSFLTLSAYVCIRCVYVMLRNMPATCARTSNCSVAGPIWRHIEPVMPSRLSAGSRFEKLRTPYASATPPRCECRAICTYPREMDDCCAQSRFAFPTAPSVVSRHFLDGDDCQRSAADGSASSTLSIDTMGGGSTVPVNP